MSTTARKPAARKPAAAAAPAYPDMPATPYGQGITVAVRDGVAVVTFALGANFGPSATGKTVVTAKAGYSESIRLPDGSRLQVGAYRKASS